MVVELIYDWTVAELQVECSRRGLVTGKKKSTKRQLVQLLLADDLERSTVAAESRGGGQAPDVGAAAAKSIGGGAQDPVACRDQFALLECVGLACCRAYGVAVEDGKFLARAGLHTILGHTLVAEQHKRLSAKVVARILELTSVAVPQFTVQRIHVAGVWLFAEDRQVTLGVAARFVRAAVPTS